jgi:hypothetical protein
MKKQIALAGVGVGLVMSLVGQPLMASAAIPLSAPASVAIPTGDGGISREERTVLAGRVEAAAAKAATAFPLAPARGGEPSASVGDQRNIVSALAKKALLEVLRHSISKVPAKIRPYVNKIIGVVEDLQQFQQTAVVTALVHAGVPSDVAAAAAQWIIVFLGL